MSKHIQTVPIGCSTITWWSGYKRVTLIQLLYLSSWSQLQWSGHKKYVQHQRRLVSEIVVWSKYIIICCCYSNTQLPPAKHITCSTIWKSWVRSQNVRVFTILILILMDDPLITSFVVKHNFAHLSHSSCFMFNKINFHV